MVITEPSDIKIDLVTVRIDVRDGLVCRYDGFSVLLRLMRSLDSRAGSQRDCAPLVIQLRDAHQILIEVLSCIGDLGGGIGDLLWRIGGDGIYCLGQRGGWVDQCS